MFETVPLDSPAQGAGPVRQADPGFDHSFDRVDRVVALEREIARLQAEQASEVAAHVGAWTRVTGDRAVAAEIGLARGVSTAAAEHQVAAALTLTGQLPRLFDLLRRGEISWAGARAVCREIYDVVDSRNVAEIDRRLAAAVERSAARWWPVGTTRPRRNTVTEVVAGVPRIVELPDVRPRAATTSRLAQAARRLVQLLEPEAAGRRAARRRQERNVQLLPGLNGAAALVADLPAEQAAACWHSLDHHARCLRSEGDDRSISQLMADTLVERITGLASPGGLLPPAAQVGVLVKASTLSGDNHHPGHLVGYGPIPASVARTLATAQTSTLHRVVVDAEGRVLSVDRRDSSDPVDSSVRKQQGHDRFFTGAMRRFVFLRDGACRMPTCDSPIRDVDHIHPHTAGGPTTADNGQGLSVRCHHLRDLPGWTVTGNGNDAVVWTTPTGHRYESRPPPALGWASEPP